MDRDKEKCVIVVDETLSLGMAANTAVILGLTLGEEEPSIIGPKVRDKSGREHLGITIAPIPVLKGSRAVMMELREKLCAHDAPHDMYIGEVTELIRS